MKKARQRPLSRDIKALEALPVSATVLDGSGRIVAVNDTWKEFGRRNGLRIPDAGVGANYLQHCAEAEFKTELKALLAGRLDLLTLVYPCHSPGEKRWFSLIGVPLSRAKPRGVALLHVNLTSMLPAQIRMGRMQVETTGRRLRPKTDVDWVSGTIEHSVSEALSSQLNTMFTVTHQSSARGKPLAYREADQLPVRHQLSERQIQVLRLLGDGKTNKEIAEALFRSPNTIKLHVSAILKQLKLKSRTQAALIASRLYKEGSSDLAAGNVVSLRKTHTARAQRRARR